MKKSVKPLKKSAVKQSAPKQSAQSKQSAPDLVPEIQRITVTKAADLLGKNEHSVRQLIFRDKLKTVNIGGRMFLILDDVLTYFARKRNLPSWDENIKSIEKKAFIASARAAQSLMVQETYIIRLIQNKTLEGYVTSANEVMVSEESINAMMRKPDASENL